MLVIVENFRAKIGKMDGDSLFSKEEVYGGITHRVTRSHPVSCKLAKHGVIRLVIGVLVLY